MNRLKVAWTARVVAVGAGLALALSMGVTAAGADTGPRVVPFDTAPPAINFQGAPSPVLGSVLSDSSGQTGVKIKQGWTIFDPDGVCTANANNGVNPAWTFVGNPKTTSSSGSFVWSLLASNFGEVDVNATDCVGNPTGVGEGFFLNLNQEGAASYSRGWSTGTCGCWSGGGVLKSSTVGAKANFPITFQRRVSLVSDKGPSRGKAAVYIDGVFKKTITLSAATTHNRVIVWNSGTFAFNSSHVLTVKVVSGRVDIDAFLTISG
jgi:hypothetical protein